MQPVTDGLIYWSTPRATVGLVIEGGVVVDAPPYARRSLGRRVEDLPVTGEMIVISCPHIAVVGTEEGLVCRLCKVHLTPQGMILSDQQDDIDWGPVQGSDDQHDNPMTDYPGVTTPMPSGPSFPEVSDNPHEHRYTITMKGGVGYDAPWVVVHASTPHECISALHELDTYGFYPVLEAAQRSLRAVSPGRAAPAQAGPPQAPMGQGGPPFGPNVSVPSAPGYQGPPVGGGGGQWAAPMPQSGGWNGGGQQGSGYGGGQSGKAEPQPNPGGWYKVNARSGPGFDNWKAMREQQKDALKGKVKWAGGPEYWVEPSWAQWIAQQGWAVSQ